MVGRSNPVARTSFWKWSVLATLTITGPDVVTLPAVSRACARSVWAPLLTSRVSQLRPYGACVSTAPVRLPSTRNETDSRLVSSLASAVIGTIPLTVSFGSGAVIEAVGGVVSTGAAALKATACITHAEPFWVAVAL